VVKHLLLEVEHLFSLLFSSRSRLELEGVEL
jgi:hypothetical protein